ncbi:DEAD/DEAH box helicase [Cupriavidus sp. D39]|uniref:DEAD/DEAH box helicase n=1 Tax=Cupriavidus sp. D39 TaxID=2997877 RepID=UPI00226D55E6|nr:DEAD/DEAH box helicase [Cupriavidus sp. D39]MCY0854022.1 DEAD/DEAH box helicase [Cupriavidus sp. D39]
MKQTFQGWDVVAQGLVAAARDQARLAEGGTSASWLNEGQQASLHGIAKRIAHNGTIIADEVGMGKTRIATTVARSVIEAGGRVAILVPPGLGFQWHAELAEANVNTPPPLLRSLPQYLAAWESDDPSQHQPWFDQKVVLISHSFANWRLGRNGDTWRWALLPQLYAHWRKQCEGRFPRQYHDNEKLPKESPCRAAIDIVQAISAAPDGLAGQLIRELADSTPWPGALDPQAYRRDEELRPWLERAVGLGLGIFDLVIVDEAHKSRKTDSVLSSLLDRVVLRSQSARRLAMTATPVELNAAQWKEVLARIDVDAQAVEGTIDNYAKAVGRVRQTPTNEDARRAYKNAADNFHEALSPYLLRRDKREDNHVQAFAIHAKAPVHAYRREAEIAIDTASLDPSWKQAVCAAEALSVVANQSDSQSAKRLRLTFGNGHGIAALIRQVNHDVEYDYKKSPSVSAEQDQGDADRDADADAASVVATVTLDKREQRADWWMRVLTDAFQGTEDPLFGHPAIIAAVHAIEQITSEGEKVLVFGRFTKPLQALVDLLNARAMLRCIDQRTPWPQAKVPDDGWEAIAAAHQQLQRPGSLQPEQLERALAEQYKSLEQQRERYRDRLLTHVHAGLAGHADNARAKRLFDAFRKSVDNAQQAEDERSPLAVVAKAMQELLGPDTDAFDPKAFASAFIELVDASADRDEGDTDGNGTLDEEEATELWDVLEKRLDEEYNRPQGGFARLMFGGTKPDTRRLLQLAFNRENSFPKVLVAQSTVGREGLNLHKACRTVVLLHPEWNPGVVEQQIGRVDRVGSLWETHLDEAIRGGISPGDLPRIEIRPIVFKGTYDEKNWQVLRERWDDLRAQLHGVVISPLIAAKYEIPQWIVDEINGFAPNFSPRAPGRSADQAA